jgi:hypothetical protein
MLRSADRQSNSITDGVKTTRVISKLRENRKPQQSGRRLHRLLIRQMSNTTLGIDPRPEGVSQRGPVAASHLPGMETSCRGAGFFCDLSPSTTCSGALPWPAIRPIELPHVRPLHTENASSRSG